MDKEEINKRVLYIKKKLETLKLAIEDYSKQEKPFEKYKVIKTIERDSEEIVESATRINQEILSQKNFIAESYRESFEKLFEFEIIIDKKFLEKLANTTGFRNRLAHEYMNLDDKVTFKSAEQLIKLYPKYLMNIVEYLEKN